MIKKVTQHSYKKYIITTKHHLDDKNTRFKSIAGKGSTSSISIRQVHAFMKAQNCIYTLSDCDENLIDALLHDSLADTIYNVCIFIISRYIHIATFQYYLQFIRQGN